MKAFASLSRGGREGLCTPSSEGWSSPVVLPFVPAPCVFVSLNWWMRGKCMLPQHQSSRRDRALEPSSPGFSCFNGSWILFEVFGILSMEQRLTVASPWGQKLTATSTDSSLLKVLRAYSPAWDVLVGVSTLGSRDTRNFSGNTGVCLWQETGTLVPPLSLLLSFPQLPPPQPDDKAAEQPC